MEEAAKWRYRVVFTFGDSLGKPVCVVDQAPNAYCIARLLNNTTPCGVNAAYFVERTVPGEPVEWVRV